MALTPKALTAAIPVGLEGDNPLDRLLANLTKLPVDLSLGLPAIVRAGVPAIGDTAARNIEGFGSFPVSTPFGMQKPPTAFTPNEIPAGSFGEDFVTNIQESPDLVNMLNTNEAVNAQIDELFSTTPQDTPTERATDLAFDTILGAVVPGGPFIKTASGLVNAGLSVGINTAVGGETVITDMMSDDGSKVLATTVTPAPVGTVVAGRDDPNFEGGINLPGIGEFLPEDTIQAREIDRLLTEQENKETAKSAAFATATAATVIGAVLLRKRLKLTNTLPNPFAPLGQAPKPKGAQLSIGDRAHAAFIDESTDIKGIMEQMVDEGGNPVFTPKQVDTIVRQEVVDSYGRAVSGMQTGFLGGVKIPKFSDWLGKVRALGSSVDAGGQAVERREILFAGMHGIKEKQDRVSKTFDSFLGTLDDDARAAIDVNITTPQKLTFLQDRGIALEEVGLWKNNFPGAPEKGTPISNPNVDTMISKMRSDPELSALADEYGKMGEGVIDYLLQRRIITNQPKAGETIGFADQLRNRVAIGSEQSLFVPGIDLTDLRPDNLTDTLLDIVGLHSSKGREVNQMQNFMSSGGVTNPLNPADAMANYIYQVVDHADTNAFQWNLLSRISKFVDGKPSTNLAPNEFAEFIGSREFDDTRRLNAFLADEGVEASTLKKLGIEKDFASTEAEAAAMDQIVSVHRDGKEFLWHVPNPGIRQAIRNRPQDIAIANQIGRKFKNTFQFFTTRANPFFAPKSFAYSAQQVLQNSIARNERTAVGSLKDSFQGVWEHASTNLSRELADKATHALRSETGMFNLMPKGATEKFISTLEKKIENSYLTGLQQESGTLATSIFQSDVNPSVKDILKHVAPGYNNDFSTTMMLGRMYSHILRAAYEGPAMGAAIAKMGPRSSVTQRATNAVDRQLVREAGDIARKLAGNVRNRGTSIASQTLHSWVPFSGPMVQSWNSIGSGLNHAIKQGNYGRAIASLTVPTSAGIMVALNNSIQGPEWNDYYWNVLTDDQRNNNYIFHMPGADLDNFLAIPVAPEWTLGNAIAIEMMDAITGASHGGLYNEEQQNPFSDDDAPNGAHIINGLTRIFDIPIPPAAQAAFALGGERIRLGPQFDVDEGFSLGENVPLGKGEQLSANKGNSRYMHSAMDTEMEGVYTAILGTVGSAYSSIDNAFELGKAKGGYNEGLEQAGDALAKVIRKQTPYIPMWGSSAFEPSQFDETAEIVRAKFAGFGKLKEFRARLDAGPHNISLQNPVPLPGGVDVPEDPVIRKASEHVIDIGLLEQQHTAEISVYRKMIDDLRNNVQIGIGAGRRDLSPEERQNGIEDWTMKIKHRNAQTLIMLHDAEEVINSQIREQLDRDADFKLEGLEARPNLIP